jgi:hypothetical protein
MGYYVLLLYYGYMAYTYYGWPIGYALGMVWFGYATSHALVQVLYIVGILIAPDEQGAY